MPNASAPHCLFVTATFFAKQGQPLQRKRAALEWYCAATVPSILGARAPAVHVVWHAVLHGGFANMTLPALCRAAAGRGLVTRQPAGPDNTTPPGRSAELVRHVARLREGGACALALSFTRLDGDDVLASDAVERLHAAAVAPREACMARLACVSVSGSKRVLQLQLGTTEDGAPRCAAVSRARDWSRGSMWSVGQTVSMPWQVWHERCARPEGAHGHARARTLSVLSRTHAPQAHTLYTPTPYPHPTHTASTPLA